MTDDEGDGVLSIGTGHSPCLARNIGSVLEIPHKASTTPSSRTRTRTNRPPTTIPSLALIYVPRKRLQLETLSLSTDRPTIAYFTVHLLIETPFAMGSDSLKSGEITQCIRFVHGRRVAIYIRLN